VPSLAAVVGSGGAAHPAEDGGQSGTHLLSLGAEILDVGFVHQVVDEGEDADGDGGAGLGPRGRDADLRQSPVRSR
jgi:hypothetical protein